MGPRIEQPQTPTLEVARVNGAFFGAVVDGDDTPEGRSLLELGEEVNDEADAGVESDCRGVVQGFFSFCKVC